MAAVPERALVPRAGGRAAWPAAILAACGLAAGSLVGCGPSLDRSREAASATSTTASAEDPSPVPAVTAPTGAVCEEQVPVWRDGSREGEVCPEDAAAEGLTVLDLGDGWVPRLFRPDPRLGARGRSTYHDRYLTHAEERWPEGTPRWRKRRRPPPRYLELYGILPTLRVLRDRLLDDERHRCHEDVDDDALAAMEATLRPRNHGGIGRQIRRARWVTRMERVLDDVRTARGLESIDELADDPRWGRKLARLEAARRPVDAVAAVQAHLRCDGLDRRDMRDGAFDGPTLWALRRWQRKHMIVGRGVLDDDSREAMLRSSRENDFRAVLRALRERVADAAGLLADGSAAGEPGEVLGRQLDPPELRVMAARDALPGAARDVVSPATEAAARALGWIDPAAAAAWLEAHVPEEGQATHRVAVPLPPAPAWHEGGQPLDVHATIDRGDVWYRAPFFDDGRPRGRPVRRRPTLVVAVEGADGDRPLVRWSTTIGGWHRERADDGTIGLAYKNSPVGPRVWRDLLAAPTWMPPPATPDEELLRAGRTLMGPGFESAFGLVMLQHAEVHGARHEDVVAGRVREGDQPPPEEGGDGRGVRFGDEGIRTHGSVSYRSILHGESHGCHRLFNHLAVRLGGWLLTHREHVRHGPQPARYRRTLVDPEHPDDPEHTVELAVDFRGDRFELTPPVPVTVLKGRLRGWPRRPIEGVIPIPGEEPDPPDGGVPDAGPADAGPADAGRPSTASTPGPTADGDST